MKKILQRIFETIMFGTKRYRRNIEEKEYLFDELWKLVQQKDISFGAFKYCICRNMSVEVNGKTFGRKR